MSDSVGIDSPVRHPPKRPRPVISCLECRRKKLKCDRTIPCQQCVKTGRPSICSYQAGQEPESRLDDVEPSPKQARLEGQTVVSHRTRSPTDLPIPDATEALKPLTGLGIIERLQQRLIHVESLLGVAHDDTQSTQPASDQSSNKPHRKSLTNPIPSRHDNPSVLFPTAASFIQTFRSLETIPTNPRLKAVMHNLRSLQESLKQHHRLGKASSIGVDTSHVLNLIPSQTLCISLAELYFDNMEHCFRILHRQTFYAELQAFFENPNSSSAQDFLPHLVMVISISALLGTSRDSAAVATANDGLLLQMSVEYVKNYLRGLKPRERRSISYFQTQLLFLLLRWMKLDRISDLWELSGTILRQALMIGMDRDPQESEDAFSPFQREMRRRLWMTIVEDEMMLSILSNMPCMVPNFSCQAPLNLNDEDILKDTSAMPTAKPYDRWTDTLCQCYLADTIKERLDGLHLLQSSSEVLYEQILQHTRLFEKFLQQLPPPLRFDHQTDMESKAPARLMARMELDISIRRPLMHLYSPFAHANDSADVFAEARAGFLQSCLMIVTYQDFFDPKYSEMDVDSPDGYWDFFYNIYRHELNQSVLGLCFEIKRLKSLTQPNTPVANEGFPSFRMPNYTKASIIHAVRDTLDPMTRRITRFGADLKDLTYITLIFQSVLSVQEDTTDLIEGLEDHVEACRSQIERDQLPILTPSTMQDSDSMDAPNPSLEFYNNWLYNPNPMYDFGFPNVNLDFSQMAQPDLG